MPVATAGDVRRQGRWVDLWLVLAVLALTSPFLREWTAQPASRYLFTASGVDQRTFALDAYKESLGIDLAIVKGHAYSDKAPYQPVLSLPVYGLYRVLGGEPFPEHLPAGAVGHRADISLWMITMWSATIPLCVLAVLIRRYVARVYPEHAVKVALALSCGTVLMPFGSLLFGHMLAASVGFAAWYVLRRAHPTWMSLLGGGLLLGAGPGIEYPQVCLALVIGIWSLFAFRWRAAWVALGGFIGGVPLLVFNTVTFGGPFTTAYQGFLPNFQGGGAFGVYNLVKPDGHEAVLALIGDRGLLSITPAVLFALLACFYGLRQKSPTRLDLIMALTVLALYLITSTGIDGYGGSAPGPRYLVPAVPFFAIPLAEAWRRWPAIVTVAAMIGAFFMTIATTTDPLYERDELATLVWLRHVAAGEFDASIPGTLVHPRTIVLFVIAAGVCAALALRANRGLVAPSDPGTGAVAPVGAAPA